MKIAEDQIAERLQKLKEWEWEREDAKWIRRRYRFDTFRNGIEFVRRVAELAEQLNHHPMIAIDYKMVTLRLTTWHEAGLTELDFTAAAAFDETFASR